MDSKHIQFGNEGEELVPGKTENLSSALHAEGDAALPNGFIGEEGGDEAEHEPDQFDKRSDAKGHVLSGGAETAHRDQGQGYVASQGEADTGAASPETSR